MFASSRPKKKKQYIFFLCDYFGKAKLNLFVRIVFSNQLSED